MTIRELARRLHLSKSAISLALKDDPQLPLITRRRVRRLADRLGYRPDPTLSKVMAAIARRGEVAVTSPLILLTDWPEARYYEDPAHHLDRYYKGVIRRARELGYRVEELWMAAPRMTPARAEQILAARGIQGVIVFNYRSAPAVLSIDLSNYASAVIGRALIKPRLFAIDHDHYQGLFECMEQLGRRGSHRPGLILSVDAHERTMHSWAAAYQFWISQRPASTRVPFFLIGPGRQSAFRTWVKRYRPDAILTHDESVLDFINAAGFKIPADFDFAVLFWRGPQNHCAGIDTQDEIQGARAVELVVEQMRNNQHGLPSAPETVLFDGIWRDGPSVKGLPA